jgi:lipoic acid synthetase
MILGNICTRSCRFCNTATGKPLAPASDEPEKLAESVRLMGLRHAVVTSVDRDDLPDQGAAHWAECIKAIRRENPNTTIEVLLPDFQGREELLQQVIEASPNILGHNIETVRRITPNVRSAAKYERSLKMLKRMADSGITTKSSIMLGLGESRDEILETMDDLRSVGVSIFTLGQYLQPTRQHLPVSEYVHPDTFAEYKEIALEKGFRSCESGPLVRSSYHAERHI